MSRIFTDTEIKKAETLLLVLAHESSKFWANAFLSPSFLYHGEVKYCVSSFYKNDSWKDFPSKSHETITGLQIVKFTEKYMQEASKSICRWIQNDVNIAIILGIKNRMNDVNYVGRTKEFDFGGWDNDPIGAVASAKEEAELIGMMSINSHYRKTRIILRNGTIYRWHNGYTEPIKAIDIQNE